MARIVCGDPVRRTSHDGARGGDPLQPSRRRHGRGRGGLRHPRRQRAHASGSTTSRTRGRCGTTCCARSSTRRRVADPAAREALLTVVIVGAGPTGVEMAGALAEFRRHVIPRDYRASRRARAAHRRRRGGAARPRPLPRRPPRAHARATWRRSASSVRTGAAVARVTADAVELAGGERIATGTVIWAAGIRGGAGRSRTSASPPAAAAACGSSPRSPCRDMPGVFAAGDVALVEGAERLPQVAQVAIQQGGTSAENVLREPAGRAAAALRLRGQGLDGDHRPQPRGCRDREDASRRPARLVGVARGPHRHADRVPEPPGRAGQLGVELPHLRPRRCAPSWATTRPTCARRGRESGGRAAGPG